MRACDPRASFTRFLPQPVEVESASACQRLLFRPRNLVVAPYAAVTSLSLIARIISLAAAVFVPREASAQITFGGSASWFGRRERRCTPAPAPAPASAAPASRAHSACGGGHQRRGRGPRCGRLDRRRGRRGDAQRGRTPSVSGASATASSAESATLTGGVGLLHLQHAQGGAAGQFRVGFTTEYFSAGFLCTPSFPCQNPAGSGAAVTEATASITIGGTITLTATVTKWLEAYAGTGAFANSDSPEPPALAAPGPRRHGPRPQGVRQAGRLVLSRRRDGALARERNGLRRARWQRNERQISRARHRGSPRSRQARSPPFQLQHDLLAGQHRRRDRADGSGSPRHLRHAYPERCGLPR